MAGASLTISWREEAVVAALRDLAATLKHPKRVMADIGRSLRASTLERFRTERDPDDRAWIPSRRRAEGSPRPTLTLSARLRSSISSRATDSEVRIGTNVIYAATHQFGGTIRPKTAKALVFALPSGQWVQAKAVTIPARPFLGVSADDRQEIVAIVRDAVAKATQRGGASA
jgi:phage virion morphogenesis protein